MDFIRRHCDVTLDDFDGHFALNSVLRVCVWSSDGFRSLATLKLLVNVVGEL